MKARTVGSSSSMPASSASKALSSESRRESAPFGVVPASAGCGHGDEILRHKESVIWALSRHQCRRTIGPGSSIQRGFPSLCQTGSHFGRMSLSSSRHYSGCRTRLLATRRRTSLPRFGVRHTIPIQALSVIVSKRKKDLVRRRGGLRRITSGRCRRPARFRYRAPAHKQRRS